MMFFTSVLNRLRGSQAAFQKMCGFDEDSLFYKYLTGAVFYNIVFGLYFWLITGEAWTIAVGIVLFLIGERSTWGKWIGQILNRSGADLESERGKSFPYIHHIANAIIKEEKNYLNYARVALFFRSLYWWGPSIVFLAWYSPLDWLLGSGVALWLGLMFPVAVELARWVKIKDFGTWATQELIYGFFQGTAWTAIFFFSR